MRSLLAALALLCLVVSSCGSTQQGDPSSSAGGRPNADTVNAGVVSSKRDVDHDNDSVGAIRYDADDAPFLNFGQAAGPGDERSIDALVKRYYAAAAAGDGARVCRMMYSLLAESLVEEDGGAASRGETCARLMTRLLKAHRRGLRTEAASMRVIRVRVLGEKALAFMLFAGGRERHLVLRREGRAWKLDIIFDEEMS